MPAPVIAAIIAGGATAATGIIGSKIQSGAAKDAASAQIGGANRAADIQAQSAREALAFQKEQAAADAARFEHTQRSNYDQWAARQGYQSSIGSMLGLPARNIPGYQSSMPSGSPQGMPSAGGADAKAAAFIADWQKTHPVSEGIAPLAAALQKAGLSTGRFMYGQTPSDNEVNIGGQKYKVLGGENTPAASWYVPGTNDAAPGAAIGGGTARWYVAPLSSFLPQPYQPLTPALRMPGGY